MTAPAAEPAKMPEEPEIFWAHYAQKMHRSVKLENYDALRTFCQQQAEQIEQLRGEVEQANKEAQILTDDLFNAERQRDSARKTNRHYETALYFHVIRPAAVQDGDDAVEIHPMAVKLIIERAEQAEARVKVLEAANKRYETVRRMRPAQFAELFRANIEQSIPFDDLVDNAATKEPTK